MLKLIILVILVDRREQMLCSSGTTVDVTVVNNKGNTVLSISGHLANGGILSVTRELNPAPDDQILIKTSRGDKSWKVLQFTPAPKKNKGKYVYNLNLALT